MTTHTEALFSLSKLLSPAVTVDEAREIVISKNTPWNLMIDFANQHLLIPALYSALVDKNLLKLGMSLILLI